MYCNKENYVDVKKFEKIEGTKQEEPNGRPKAATWLSDTFQEDLGFDRRFVAGIWHRKVTSQMPG